MKRRRNSKELMQLVAKARTKRDKARACFSLAIFHDNNSREAEAIPYYEQALKAGLDKRTKAEALAWLASSLYKTKRYKEAFVRLEEAYGAASGEKLKKFLDGLRTRILRKLGVRWKKWLPSIIRKVGFDFRWDSKKVWALRVPVEMMDIKKLTWHFDIPFWEKDGTDAWNLKPWKVIREPHRHSHYRQAIEADLTYPFDIMWNKGRWVLLDGLHRLVQAYVKGHKKVRVRKIPRIRIPDILA